MTDIKIFTRPVQHMCSYNFRPQYQVQDFAKDVRDHSMEIVGETVLLLIGNNHLDQKEPGNIGKQIGKIAKLICTQNDTVSLFVCGLMPRPDKPNEMRLQIGAANKKIGDMARSLAKYQQLNIKYIPVHQAFLEKCKTINPVTKKVAVITQVRRPLETYFKPDLREFNHQGRKLLRQKLWQVMENPTQLLGNSIPVVWCAQHLTVVVDAEDTDTDQATGSECSAESLAVANKVKVSTEHREGASSGLELVRPAKKLKGQVAQMVKKWETSTANPGSSESLDVELGRDNVISVPLGDE